MRSSNWPNTAAKEPWPLAERRPTRKRPSPLGVDALGRAGIAEAYQEKVKQARYEKVGVAKKAISAALAAEGLDPEKAKGLNPRSGSRRGP